MKEGQERRFVEEALAELEELGRKEGKPHRQLARALLVPLGSVGLADGMEAVQPWLERARAAASLLGDAWTEAVLAELSLACAEHVHAVDERYLGLPNYDFAYTLAARERLAARLWAARALGFEPPEVLARGVAQADTLLARYTGEPPQ